MDSILPRVHHSDCHETNYFCGDRLSESQVSYPGGANRRCNKLVKMCHEDGAKLVLGFE